MKRLFLVKDKQDNEIFVLSENLDIVKNRFDFPVIKKLDFVDLTVKQTKVLERKNLDVNKLNKKFTI